MAGPPDLLGTEAEASEPSNVAGNLKKLVSFRGLMIESSLPPQFGTGLESFEALA